MRTLHLIGAVFASTGVFAQSCPAQGTTPSYNVPGYPRSDGCYPTNYNAAYDLGSTSPADATTRCRQQCAARNDCASYVASLNKAADSNNYSGQCYFYSSSNPPSTPRSCTDKPTVLYAEYKDTSLDCFSSNKAAATSFCSSYLRIGTPTTFTRTSTPTGLRSTVVTTVTTAVVTTSTTIISSQTITSTIYETDISTISATSTPLNPYKLVKRALAATPSCVPPSIPSASLSADCSCLMIKSTTVSAVSTAPISYSTSTSVATSVTLLTTTSTISSTTTISTSVTSSTTTSTTTIAATASPSCSAAPNGNLWVNGDFETGSASGYSGTGSPGFTVSSTDVYCGKYAGYIHADSATVSQTFSFSSADIAASPRLTFQLRYKGYQEQPGCSFYVQCGDATNQGTQSSGTLLQITTASQTWAPYTLSCTKASSFIVSLVVSGGGGFGTCKISVDDLALY